MEGFIHDQGGMKLGLAFGELWSITLAPVSCVRTVS